MEADTRQAQLYRCVILTPELGATPNHSGREATEQVGHCLMIGSATSQKPTKSLFFRNWSAFESELTATIKWPPHFGYDKVAKAANIS